MNTPLETFTATAPSCWASYLINGDASGITEEEQAQADMWQRRMNGDSRNVSPVSCEDAGFIRRHDAFSECPLSADCQTYTFIKQ